MFRYRITLEFLSPETEVKVLRFVENHDDTRHCAPYVRQAGFG